MTTDATPAASRTSPYLDLARAGLRTPIGTDLVLHEHPDHEAIVLDGERLGRVVIDSARRYRTPLALPLMDLRIEKALMLRALDIAEADIDAWHFDAAPGDEVYERVEKRLSIDAHPRPLANVRAIERVAREKDLIPCGMAIGPFSLMTKLVADPITAVYLAGSGATAEQDEEIRRIERVLELGVHVILRSIRAQIDAGARAICLCEPAANKVYISPNQIGPAGTGDVFDRYVMSSNRRIKDLLDSAKVDLIFHDCGELLDPMIERFVTLRPVILSLGSSRRLWEDARLVPDDIVLFGNLPTKRFYSDQLTPLSEVRRMRDELLARMSATGKPFILGSECDVLWVPDSAATIQAKVAAMLER